MTKQYTPMIPIGTEVVDGTKRFRIIAILEGIAVMRPEAANANDYQDFGMPVEDIQKKMNAVDFELIPPPIKTLYGSTALPKNRPRLVDLSDAEQLKVLFNTAAMLVLEEYNQKFGMKITEKWIDANHGKVSQKTEKLFREATGRKRRSSTAVKSFDLPAGKKLARMYKDFQADFFDPADLATGHSRAGRKPVEYPDWVMELIRKSADKYLDGREKSLKDAFLRLLGSLQEENAKRRGIFPGHEDVSVSESKYRRLVNAMPSAAVMATRKGRDEMLRSMRAGIGEMIALMIGEGVQFDECEVELWVFLEKTGLHRVVGERTMRQLRKEAENGTIGKVWILVAYDVASGAPLAFHIARSQNADDTLELIRRLVSDKTKLAREAGCKHPPPPAVRPFLIVMDTGSGFWNGVVPTAILKLGAMFRFGRTKSPTDKAFIERFFGTLGDDVFRALHGHSGNGPGSVSAYDGQEMAVMTIAQLEKYIWWYFCDCLPFKTTQRKGGWGIERRVLFDRLCDDYGLLPPISRREVRLALGLKVTRVVTKMGIEAFRMPFQGDGPGRRWVLDNIGEEVTVYVDPHSIEEVTLKTADGQTFYFKSSLSQFKDFTLQEWVHFLEEWRASDPLSKSISVEALHRFYKRIDAENDKLLDFYGKEHKVIKLDDAQTLCDGLAGNDLSILPYNGGSDAASPTDIYRGAEEGEGIFVPGGVVIEEAEIIEDIPPAREPKSKPTKTFTGAAKGKGVLK